MPTCKHKKSGEAIVRSVSTDVCCQGVPTDSDDIYSKARFLSDDSLVHYSTGLPGCEMLRLAFEFILEYFWGRECAFYSKSLIIVLLKHRLNYGFLEIFYTLGVSITTVSQTFHEILDLITTRFEWFVK